MAIEIACDCGELLLVSSRLSGKSFECPKCFDPLFVPIPAGEDEVSQSSMAESICPQCLNVLSGEKFCEKCGVDIKAWRAVSGKLKKDLPKINIRAKGTSGPGSNSAGRRLVQKMVDSMRLEMKSLRNQLKDRDDIEKSLQEARKKQLNMLPQLPYLPEISFHAHYRPCHHIGGDFYDFIQVSDREIGFAVGDVSGHGLEAALIMSMVKKTLGIHGRGCSSPKEAICLTNEDLWQDLDSQTFVTIFYGVFHTEKKTLRFCKAGHNPLIVYNPQKKEDIQVYEPEGMGVGLATGELFRSTMEEQEIELKPGDLLLQFTDGVTETMDRKGNIYGMERFLKKVEEYSQFDLEYMIYLLVDDLEKFRRGEEQLDDVTLVAARLEG